MQITTSEENGITVLTLKGRLDTTTTTIYDQTFREALKSGANQVVLDCRDLTFISSVGLRSILQSLKRLAGNQGTLAIASLSPIVMEVFEISGFKSLFPICPDCPSAIAALQKS